MCYNFNKHPLLLLKPVKIEMASLKPDIYLLHDIIRDSDIEFIKDLAAPRVGRGCILIPGGVLLGILGRGVPLCSSNPGPILDQNMPFFTPVFRPDLVSSKFSHWLYCSVIKLRVRVPKSRIGQIQYE